MKEQDKLFPTAKPIKNLQTLKILFPIGVGTVVSLLVPSSVPLLGLLMFGNLIKEIGVFDYDPCGLEFHKTANKIISLPTDGLLEEWKGKVWLNPPYSNPKPFIKKLSEYGNGIALVLNSTDTVWFQEYGLKKADAMFLLKGRPKFTRLDMTEVSIMRGVVLFAYGKDNALKLKECGLKGYYVALNGA